MNSESVSTAGPDHLSSRHHRWGRSANSRKGLARTGRAASGGRSIAVLCPARASRTAPIAARSLCCSPRLAAVPHPTAVDIMRRLGECAPDSFGDKQVRTLQRFVKSWRAKTAKLLIAGAETTITIQLPTPRLGNIFRRAIRGGQFHMSPHNKPISWMLGHCDSPGHLGAEAEDCHFLNSNRSH